MLLFRIVLLYEGIKSSALYPEDTSPSSAVTGRETKLGKVTNLPPPPPPPPPLLKIYLFSTISVAQMGAQYKLNRLYVQ